jgi:hypothetical protein
MLSFLKRKSALFLYQAFGNRCIDKIFRTKRPAYLTNKTGIVLLLKILSAKEKEM